MDRMTRTNGRRDGKLTASIFAAAAMYAFCAGGYATSDWDPNGSGTWSEATRWKSGSPLPTEQDRSVKITSADAFATDEDYSILKNLIRVRFSGTATLDLRFDEDHTDFSLNSVQNLDSAAHGTMIKSGTGLLVDSTSDAKYAIPNYLVTNGILKIAVDPANVKFGVHSPGTLVFTKASTIIGLEGDGVVSNSTSGTQLHFTGGTRESPIVFDGTLGRNINPSFDSGCQHFTTMNSPYGRDVRIYGGFVGLKNFGTTGESGTLGTSENFWFQGTGGMVYLGDGETTNKKLNFGLNCVSATLDAGATGGVTYTSEWSGKECPRMYLLNLEGSNTVRCVISGGLTGNATNAMMVVKRGSGTWQFAGARSYISTVTVEDGTLEYDSMAETGTESSLGTSSRLYADTTGLMKNLTPVPWAFRLGTHSTTGTLAYVGSADVACTSRLFVVRGTGVVRSDTAAALSYVGATSYDEQGGTLVLDGTGSYDHFADVTNGVGPLVVEKRGGGTWMLGRNIDLAGVTVKDGTLRISNSRQYRWYRYTVKRLWSDSENALQLTQFGLFDEDGVQQNVGLTESDPATGIIETNKTYKLKGGQFGWNHPYTYTSGRSFATMFKGNDQNGLTTVYRSGNSPNVNNPSRWLSVTMRVADNANTVKYYDVKSWGGATDGVMYKREPRVWTFEGSVDGRNWDLLDEREDITIGKGAIWYSTGKTTFNAASPGFEVATEAPENVVNLGAVSVLGGTLVADAPLSVSNLVVDATSGGTLDGFAFAENGTLTVKNLPDGNEMVALPGTYANCTGLDGVSRWTLSLDGEPTKKRISVSGGVIRIVPPGTAIVFR